MRACCAYAGLQSYIFFAENQIFQPIFGRFAAKTRSGEKTGPPSRCREEGPQGTR
jgi:hypothetical protein